MKILDSNHLHRWQSVHSFLFFWRPPGGAGGPVFGFGSHTRILYPVDTQGYFMGVSKSRDNQLTGNLKGNQ